MLTHAQRAKLETENEKLSVESFKEDTWGVFLSVNPKTDFRSKNGFRVPFGKSKSGFSLDLKSEESKSRLTD